MKREREDDNKNRLGDGKNDQEEGIVKFEEGNKKNKKKNKGKGSVQIEETEDENGKQRKVIRDLGNGKKSIEITRVMKHHHGKGKNYFQR